MKIDPKTRANQLMQIGVSDDESVNSHMILNLKDNLKEQDKEASDHQIFVQSKDNSELNLDNPMPMAPIRSPLARYGSGDVHEIIELEHRPVDTMGQTQAVFTRMPIEQSGSAEFISCHDDEENMANKPPTGLDVDDDEI